MKYKKSNFKTKKCAGTNKNEYLNKLQEWQEHQYDPGHYTGGNIPPILTHPGRPSIIGWLFVISSISFCILTATMIVRSFDEEQILPIMAVVVLTFGFYTIQFIAGVRLIHKGRLLNKGKVLSRKRSILAVSIISLLAILILGVYQINNRYDEIIITSAEQVVLKQVYDKNYIYVKSIDKTLSCSRDEYLSLWMVKVFSSQQKDTLFRLEYKWNNFNPKQGKVIKITK